jgi:hypothetical protein
VRLQHGLRLRQRLRLRQGLRLRQRLTAIASRGGSRGTPSAATYIGRKRCPNARLTFSGRCMPRTLRL